LIHEAIALTPDVALFMDLGNRLARYHADAAGARAALEHVDMELVVDMLKPLVFRLRGIVAWVEGNFDDARRELELALHELEKTRHLPYRTGNIAVVKGYLCCVYAKLGNLSAASKCYREARAYLIATEETKLLNDCETGLRIKARSG
jgi:hypothetical protein